MVNLPVKYLITPAGKEEGQAVSKFDRTMKQLKVPTMLCPVIVVKGKRLHALAHYAAPLPAKLLRRRIDNVAAQGSALVSAMDAVLSGI
jgi:hypothetical protein